MPNDVPNLLEVQGPGTPEVNPQKEQARRWLPLFREFIRELRIDSKEVSAVDERGVVFDLWGSQLLALEILCNGMEEGIRDFMFLKGRQAGISTVFLAVDIFWLAMYPGTRGALVVDKEENAVRFRQILQRYYQSFPKKYLGSKFVLVKDNKHFMEFSNGSRLDFIVAGRKKTYGEGQGYSLVHGTEVANWGSAEGLASFRETLAEKNPNRLFIWESTAKGYNHWKDMWDEYARDTITKRRGFIGWWAKELNRIERSDPLFKNYGLRPPSQEEQELIDQVKKDYGFKIEREQLAWHRWRSSNTSTTEGDTKQNQPFTAQQAFIFTGNLFFQSKVLQKNYDYAINEKFHAFKYQMGNDFWSVRLEHITQDSRKAEITLRIWEEPDPEGIYAIGMDPSLGGTSSADRHGISVWRCFADRMVQVAEFADNICETRHAAWVLAHMAGAYRDCWINIELTGGAGRAVMTEFDHLREMMKIKAELASEQQEFMKEPEPTDDWTDFLANARWYIRQSADTYTQSRRKGWETTGGVGGGRKVELLTQYRDKHGTDQLTIRSIPLVQEMLGVVQNGYEIAALGRNKDDRVFAAALAVRIWIDNIHLSLMQRGLTYDSVMNSSAEVPNQMRMFMDGLVQNFFRDAEEMADQMSPEDEWLDRRGFLK